MTIGQYSVDCCHFRGCTQHVKDGVVHVGSVDYTKIRKHARRLKSKTQSRQCLHYVEAVVQELCESRGDRPGLSVLTSLLLSVDVKLY